MVFTRGGNMLLALLGCVENKLTPQSAPAAQETGATCLNAVPADDAEPITAECMGEITPFTGEFVEVWRATGLGFATGVHAAHMSDGNGDGVVDTSDPMQVIVDAFGTDGLGSEVDVLDSDGTPLYAAAVGSYMVTSTTGDVDGTDAGAEVIVSGTYSGEGAYLDIASETGTRWSNSVASGASLYPWLADLEADGEPEAIVENFVIDSFSGEIRATLEGPFGGDVSPPVSADLNRDGVDEILAATWKQGAVYIFDPGGSMLATCLRGGGRGYSASYAVGNLDDDDDGEFAAAGDGYLVVCDSDGTPLAQISAFAGNEPALVGIGELDGDSKPEIVVSYAYGIVAFDTNLSALWMWTSPDQNWTPFSLADLDGDGLHEILVHDGPSLVVLDARGTELSRHLFDIGEGSSWKGQPIVADIDGDGLAEIVVGGHDTVVLESPTGGYPIPGAAYDWPARDHHPGDRTASGGVPAPNPFWLEPGQNVWQGLAPGTGLRPELAVTATDICVEACDGDAVVTARIANSSEHSLDRDVAVTFTSTQSGETLGTVTLSAPLAGGTGRYITLTTPASTVASGVAVTVDSEGQASECDETNNSDQTRDAICP